MLEWRSRLSLIEQKLKEMGDRLSDLLSPYFPEVMGAWHDHICIIHPSFSLSVDNFWNYWFVRLSPCEA